MRSDNVDDAELEPRTEVGVVYRLLDPTFGFIVWAVHLLIIYISTAVACVLGLGSQSANVQSGVVLTLAAFTVLTATIVIHHGIKRYRQRAEMRDHGFLIRIAVGHDAIAALAIIWQLFVLFMVPVCQ